jgi:flagellar biosynthesis/type III secretory pathway chaperone
LAQSSDIDGLIRVLEDELTLCDSFEFLLLEEAESLRRHGADKLDALSREKGRLKEKFLELEARRACMLRSIAAQSGIGPEAVMSDIAGIVPEQGSNLLRVGGLLKKRVARLRELNSRNDAIVSGLLFNTRAAAGFIGLLTGGRARGEGRLVSKRA